MKPTGEKMAANPLQVLNDVTAAERLFEHRWTLEMLKLINAQLHADLLEQMELLRASLFEESDDAVVMHGEAMCRGWQAAIREMEAAGVTENDVLIGEFGEVIVAIGRQETVPPHLTERYGERLAYLRPREVAAMYMHYRQAQSVKAIWPDAEIIGIRERSRDER